MTIPKEYNAARPIVLRVSVTLYLAVWIWTIAGAWTQTTSASLILTMVLFGMILLFRRGQPRQWALFAFAVFGISFLLLHFLRPDVLSEWLRRIPQSPMPDRIARGCHLLDRAFQWMFP